jgi:hypothetical protein
MGFFQKPDVVREPLYCIVPVQNPWRWRSRWVHTERAVKHFMDSGAVVVLIEAAFNRREFAFANSGLDGTPINCPGVLGSDSKFRHMYIPVRTRDELWLKENLINLAVQRLPYDWQQVCWLDSDVHFMRPNWVGECIQKLQHYAFLQMFSHARDLSPDYELLPESRPHADGRGFIDAYLTGLLNQETLRGEAARKAQLLDDAYYGAPLYYAQRVWPGLAWAARREAWDAVGGLQDFHVWGGGDWVASHALVGKRDGMVRADLHPNYKQMANAWYESCERYIRRNVGCMTGSIFHHWHGPKEARGYNKKHALLGRIGFDPVLHLKRDYQGVWQLNDLGNESFIQLRDTMRAIAAERDEDSTQL